MVGADTGRGPIARQRKCEMSVCFARNKGIDVKRPLHKIACAVMFFVLVLALQGAATMRVTPTPSINGQHTATITTPVANAIAANARHPRQGNDGEPCIQGARAIYILATAVGAGDACAKKFISKVPMFNAPPRYDQVVMRV